MRLRGSARYSDAFLVSATVSLLGFDQGKVNPPVEAARIGEADRDRPLVLPLMRSECDDQDDAVSFVQGISVDLALSKNLLVPWLNLSNPDGSERRL